MGFLKKLGKPASEPSQPAPSQAAPVDPAKVLKVGPAAGDPVARELVRQLTAGDWKPFADAIAAERDFRRRDFYLHVGADTFTGRPSWVDSWPASQPDFGPALLFRGMQTIDWAWQARGHLRADQTSDEQFRTFHERLGQARADLEQATRMLPGDGLPWSRLIRTYMGLGAPADTIRQLWAQIQARDPWHPDGARAMVYALTSRWQGTDEEMLAFMRTTVAAAPEGSTIHECVPFAHFLMFQERGTREYFNEPGVKEEILAAAARSIDLRRGDRDPWLVTARANFAVVYFFARWRDKLREEMLELDNTVCGIWLTLDGPAAYWRGARVEAGLDPDPRVPTA